jgi:hypothetical protein
MNDSTGTASRHGETPWQGESHGSDLPPLTVGLGDEPVNATRGEAQAGVETLSTPCPNYSAAFLLLMQVTPGTQPELNLSVTEAARRARIIGATIETIGELG